MSPRLRPSTHGLRRGAFGPVAGGRKGLCRAGELDKYYAFLSGGQSGSVFVVGIPSGRLIREIPVFEPRAAYGYAMHETDPRRQELVATGGLWGDTHHPVLSETDGVSDGKYLWINDLANGRLARIRLDYFEADRIIKIPNLQGAHGIAVVSPEHQVHRRQRRVRAADRRPGDQPGAVHVGCGVRRSRRHAGEVRGSRQRQHRHRRHIEGRPLLVFDGLQPRAGQDMGSMIQYDRDAVAAIDIPAAEKAVADGRGEVRNGVPILDPEQNPGVLTLIPVPKNPHGVNVTPDGRYAIAGGQVVARRSRSSTPIR